MSRLCTEPETPEDEPAARPGLRTRRRRRARRPRSTRLLVSLLACALLATGMLTHVEFGASAEAQAVSAAEAAAAAEPAAPGGPAAAPAAATAAADIPRVYHMMSHVEKMDNTLGYLRATLVLQTAPGYVTEQAGLVRVNGKYLRVAFDETITAQGTGARTTNLRFMNTFGPKGAEAWAANKEDRFTVHHVIHGGAHDFLVMSLEAKLDITIIPENNVLGGRKVSGNLYFGLEESLTAAVGGLDWVNDATVQQLPYRNYASVYEDNLKTGPIAQVTFGNAYGLWSNGVANWAQVLDYGLQRRAPGVLPANSVPVDIVNFAHKDSGFGQAGSVSDSFWYAWVHEDGTLVTDINTGPIHISGFQSHGTHTGAAAEVVKNIKPANGRPSLAYTPESAAQGLTDRVSVDGDIDFRDVGGTGYYRLLAWPESKDPPEVKVDYGAPHISYTAQDLFTGNRQTERALADSFVVGSVLFGYDIPRPAPPVITVPKEGDATSENRVVKIEGTGLPGHSITLKFRQGEHVVDPLEAGLTTIVDGDRSCAENACPVIVRPDGTWSFTYTAPEPLADGRYTVVAQQTEQESEFNVTSGLSNPESPEDPKAWGVTFDIDTVAPAAPSFDCPVSPTEERRPTLGGGGVEAGATVRVYLDGALLGQATVTGETWSYTPDHDLPPGTHKLTVTQTDRAGNESAPSDTACSLQINADVPIHGLKVVAPIDHPAPGLHEADPKSWRIVVQNAEGDRPISGESAVELKRGEEVTLAERNPDDGPFVDEAPLYVQRGTPVCVDDDGRPLPEKNFDPKSGKLRFDAEDSWSSEVNCTITNQAAHATLVTKRLGGQTNEASDGWRISATPINEPQPDAAGLPFGLDFDVTSAVVRPGEYKFEVAVPAGQSDVGIERLDLSREECAAQADTPTHAPESCWTSLGGRTASIEQGRHEVFRVVSAVPGEMPGLPLTGGWGSDIFTFGGLAALAAAVATQTIRARRRALSVQGLAGRL